MSAAQPSISTPSPMVAKLGDRYQAYASTGGKNPTLLFGGSTRRELSGMAWQRKLLDMLLGNRQEHTADTEALKTFEESKVEKQGLNMATLRMDNGLTPDLQTDPASVLSAKSPPAMNHVKSSEQVTPDLKSLLLALLMQAHG